MPNAVVLDCPNAGHHNGVPQGTVNWYALEVKSLREISVSRLLRAKGYEEFTPCYTLQRRQLDRTRLVEVPYLPGYVLCRYDGANNAKIVTTPGVIRIVKFCNAPAVIPEEEIRSLKIVTESGIGAKAYPFFNCGQKVEIQSGPLQGAKGRIAVVQKNCKLVVSIELLQRSIAVSVDQRWVVHSREGERSEFYSTGMIESVRPSDEVRPNREAMAQIAARRIL
jgi:transcription antitermination factor NusG